MDGQISEENKYKFVRHDFDLAIKPLKMSNNQIEQLDDLAIE